MVCIYCGGETRVINSRPQKRLNGVWRRRHCQDCQTIFTTTEEVDLTGSIVVRKINAVEPFSREKLLLSVYDSLRHRQHAARDAAGLMDTILGKLYVHVHDATLERDIITEVTALVLRRFDRVAASHYCAFHPVRDQAADRRR